MTKPYCSISYLFFACNCRIVPETKGKNFESKEDLCGSEEEQLALSDFLGKDLGAL
jgi:hypothetical protein